MGVTGKVITQTSPQWRGDTLTVAALATDTVLQLNDAVDFNNAEGGGGWLVIADESTPREYVDCDFELQTVTLAAALGVAVEADMPVITWDPDAPGQKRVVEYVVNVELDDGRGAPEALLDLESIPFASINNLLGASVELAVDDEGALWVTSVLGRQTVIDGNFIDPETLPDVELPTEPPASSPGLAVTGTTNGLVVEAEDVDQTTLIAYHITTTPPTDAEGNPLDFTPTAETLAGPPTSSTVFVVTEMPDGTRLSDLPLSAGYYMRAVASNIIGAAAPGPQASGSLDLENVSTVVTQQLTAGFGLFGNITVGGGITIGPPSGEGSTYDPGGIRIEQTGGGSIHLPADGSKAKFSGEIQTDRVTIEDNLTINGELNAIAGTLGLASVVKAPPVAPVAGYEYRRSATLDFDRASHHRGLCDTPDGLEWVTLHQTSGEVRAYRKSDGAFTRTIVSGVGGVPVGVTRVGDHYYVLTRNNNNGINVSKRTLDGTHLERFNDLVTGQKSAYPGIGTDGTNLLIVSSMPDEPSGNPWVRITTVSTSGTVLSQSGFVGKWWDSTPTVGQGPIGPNGETYTWVGMGALVFWDHNKNYLGELTPFYSSGAFLSVTDLWSMDGFRGTFSGRVSLFDSAQWWPEPLDFGFTWFDSDPGGTGTHETDMSPTVDGQPPAGSYGYVTTPPPADNGNPDDPDTVRIYINGHRQPEVPAGTRTVDYTAVTVSNIPPPIENEFEVATGNPGVLRSDAADVTGPLIELKGNGAYRLDPTKGVIEPSTTLVPTMADVLNHDVALKMIAPGVVACVGFIDIDSGPVARQATGMVIPEGMRPTSPIIVSAPHVGTSLNYRFFFNTDGTIEYESDGGGFPYESIQAIWFTG